MKRVQGGNAVALRERKTMTLNEHPEINTLTNGQQVLAQKIVSAGIATPEVVVRAFVDRNNMRIGNWKRQLEATGWGGHGTTTNIDPVKSRIGREGVAKSPWNYGHSAP